MKNLVISFITAFILVGCNSGCGGTIPTIDTRISPEGVEVNGSGEERSVSVEADGSGYGASGRGERINAGIKIRCSSNSLDICIAVGPITGLCFPLPEKVKDILCSPTTPFREGAENDAFRDDTNDVGGGIAVSE